MKQFLEILSIGYGLTEEQIGEAYYAKAKLIHTNSGVDDPERDMIMLNIAYDFLIDNYDSYINKNIGNIALSDYYEWLTIYHSHRDYKYAYQKFEKALSTNPKNPAVLKMLWLTLYKLGNTDKAKRYLYNALEYDPKNRLLYLELIDIALEENTYGELEQLKKRMRENTPIHWHNFRDKFLHRRSDYSPVEPYTNMPTSRDIRNKKNTNFYKWGFWILFVVLLGIIGVVVLMEYFPSMLVLSI